MKFGTLQTYNEPHISTERRFKRPISSEKKHLKAENLVMQLQINIHHENQIEFSTLPQNL